MLYLAHYALSYIENHAPKYSIIDRPPCSCENVVTWAGGGRSQIKLVTSYMNDSIITEIETRDAGR